jgi:hypothetical protein
MKFHYTTTTGHTGSLMGEGNKTMSLCHERAFHAAILSTRK